MLAVGPKVDAAAVLPATSSCPSSSSNARRLKWEKTPMIGFERLPSFADFFSTQRKFKVIAHQLSSISAGERGAREENVAPILIQVKLQTMRRALKQPERGWRSNPERLISDVRLRG